MNKIRMDYQKVLTFIFCALVSVNIFAAGNSVETATLVSVSGAVNGTITVEDTYDYYRLEVTEEGVLTLNGGSGNRLEMYLLDEVGGIGHNYNYSEDEVSIVHKVNPGTYYIRLTIWGYTAGNYNFISTFQAGADDAGDTEDTALILNENTTANFSFEVPGDVDYFRINLVEKGSLSFKYTGTSEVQFGATGIDTHENYLSGGPATVITSDSITYTSGVVPPGDYYVRIYLNDDSFGVGSYALETTFISVGDDHGDDITSATQVSLENYSGTVQVQGHIETSNDSDIFRIDLLSKKTVSIFSGGGEYIAGTLFDSKGVELGSYNNILGGYVDFSFTRVLPPGTYYIEAGHYGLSAESTPIYTMHFSLLPATIGDFGRNGTADILLYSSGLERLFAFEMNGTSILVSKGVAKILGWSVVDRSNDFDGDGKADILLRHNTSHALNIFLMDGSNVSSSKGIAKIPGWSVSGVADFNGDGKADILLHNETTGVLRMFLMDGITISSSKGIAKIPGWTVVATSDHNGDSKADILLYGPDSNKLHLFTMDGTNTTSSKGIANIGDWVVSNVSDYTADNKADILLYHPTLDKLHLYTMDGSTISGSSSADDLAGYTLEGYTDLDGDNKTDLLVRDGANKLHAWIKDGATTTDTGILSPVNGWSIAGLADYDGDGDNDVLLQNDSNDILHMLRTDGKIVLESKPVGQPLGWKALD